mgnify:CR=1 FL=1
MIKGLSEKRRVPRLGKIRLGVMVQEPGKKPYPKATSYLVCPSDVEKVFGEKPTRLDIMFPADDAAVIFSQELKMYRTSGLYCAGNNERARRWDEQGNLREIPCPCEYLESGECGPVATLSFFVPDCPGVGVYQLTTGNQRSIVSLNTSLETFSRMFGGLMGIPFTLILEPEQLQRFDERAKRMVKQTLHVLRLDSPYTIRQIVEWRDKHGKPVEALMPAPEPDEVSAAVLPAVEEEPAHAGVAEPVAVTPGPMAGVTPEAGLEGEWDVSMSYRAAKQAGFPPETYAVYLKDVYGRDVDNLTPQDLADEARAWQQAGESALAMQTRKSVIVARLRRIGAGQGRLL